MLQAVQQWCKMWYDRVPLYYWLLFFIIFLLNCSFHPTLSVFLSIPAMFISLKLLYDLDVIFSKLFYTYYILLNFVVTIITDSYIIKLIKSIQSIATQYYDFEIYLIFKAIILFTITLIIVFLYKPNFSSAKRNLLCSLSVFFVTLATYWPTLGLYLFFYAIYKGPSTW